MPEPTRDTMVDGRYRVVSRLGAGGMADVFLAEDQQLGRKVALKLLHRRFAEDPDFVERFRREAQAAAGLQHPNVVGIYDRGEYDGTYYIAMEYLPGRTLKQVIREEAPLDPIRAINIAIQILKAARFAHRRGIIHRDLKPHNVMIDDAGDAKVTDFGIARAGASDMTETGSIMGTAQYLSPEQAQGHSVSASSDLYSVGVVLYEMLTGRVPFDADAAVTIALKHVSEAPVPPSAINPAIPPELEQTVLWTLNKNPADRPVDADQLITVLEHCRASIEAGGAGQNTASMAAVAAGAAAGLPTAGALAEAAAAYEAAAAASDARNGTGEHATGEEGEPERQRAAWVPWAWGLLVALLVAGAATAAYFISRPKHYPVPRVTGLQLNVARTLIQNAHFQVDVINVESKKPTGTVIGENPGAGTKADKGSTVTLTVSRGQGNVSVPSVQGLSQTAATNVIKRVGLKVTHVVTQSSPTFKTGEATGTNPGAAKSVPPGTGVTLLVSSGQPQKAVPDVRGESQSAATSQLTGAGFNVNPTTQTSSSATAGNVISQDPAGGAQATAGSTVTIVVAAAPATVNVPSVTGDPTGSAFSALQSAGFHVVRQTRDVSDSSKNNEVISQSPPGGSSQKKGSTVTIVVGHYVPSSSSSSSSSSSTTTTTTSKSSSTPTTPTTSTNQTH
ncbi:MAG TPA: Stk1 family PASTA domain-containing Ser/Thr kinase [Acidimicrobiia bacterium]